MHIDLTILLYHHAPNNYVQWVTLYIMLRLAFFPQCAFHAVGYLVQLL